jgi:hypothetical protein
MVAKDWHLIMVSSMEDITDKLRTIEYFVVVREVRGFLFLLTGVGVLVCQLRQYNRGN